MAHPAAPKDYVIVENHVALVKNQIVYYRQQIERFPPDSLRYRPDTVALYQRLLQQHQQLLAFLEGLAERSATEPIEALSSPLPVPDRQLVGAINRVERAVDDLFDPLPPELLRQLSSRINRGESDPLVQIIGDHGGTATLDDILIGLYRKTGEVAKRNLVANRLYRLSKQGFIWVVPHRKGVYTTTAPEGPEA